VIVVAGEALIDMIMTHEGQFSPVAGGGPYNTARTIGRLGSDVSFLGRLSDDWFGRMLLGRLREEGVGTELVVETTDPSTMVLAEIDAAGVAHYGFYLERTSAPGLEVAEARRALSPPPDALHVGTLGLALEPIAHSLATLVQEVPDSTLVMVDPNCRPSAVPDGDVFRTRMRRLLTRADVVKVSREDLDYLALAGSHDDAARLIIQRGAGIVLLTSGGGPVKAFWAGGALEVPVEAVDVVDTIGAGDAFGSGFLVRWLEQGLGRGGSADTSAIEDAVRFGVHVASLTVQRAGADPPMRAELGES
jgi:fructokinase